MKLYKNIFMEKGFLERKGEIMKKKVVCLMLSVALAVMSVGCGFFSDYQEYRENYDEFQEYKAYKAALAESAAVEETAQETTQDMTTEETTEEVSTEAESLVQTETEPKDISSLTEEEIAVRKALQQAYVTERNEVYKWPASYEKTVKINELDRKIIENAYYSFEDMNIVFIGDSITEGVGGNIGADGKKISYVNYVDEALDFNLVLNHGLAGRTVADYGDPALSIQKSIDNLIYMDADIVVVLIGVNDYLYYSQAKRFGSIDSGSTAGYCGAIQHFMDSAARNNPDKDYFFVTLFELLGTDGSTYTDYNGTPSFNDYMNVQRTLAPRYGFNIIDIYASGLMSTADPFTTANFMPDGIHPNDAGYRILGDHIAAELLLYYEMQMEAQ